MLRKSFFVKKFFSSTGAPRSTNTREIFTPIIFNRINESLVIAGKEKVVGTWLAGISSSIFFIVAVGGYTRLTKSGLSMVRWEPKRILPPMND